MLSEDLRDAFAHIPQCMWLLGIWPDPRIPLNRFRLPNIRFIAVACILSFYMAIPQCVNVIRVWGNVDEVVQNIPTANTSLLAFSKFIATWYHSETLRTLITSLKADWTNSHNSERSTMLKVARHGKNRTFIHCGIVTLLMSIFLYLDLRIYIRNINQPQRKLIYYFIPIYNVQKSPNYEITFVLQVCGALYSSLISCSINGFITLFIQHICGQLINLQMVLNKLVDELGNKSISSSKFKKGLGVIIVRHTHLMENARTIDNCYSLMLLMYFLVVTYQVCFQCYNFYTMITNNLEVSIFRMAYYLLYATTVTTGMYNYCQAAEELSKESSNMTYGVYKCKWYNIPPKDVKDLIFIAQSSSIPLRLSAGKFAVYSMELLGTAKSAMGFISMLVTIKG